jgi:hypothetical protein
MQTLRIGNTDIYGVEFYILCFVTLRRLLQSNYNDMGESKFCHEEILSNKQTESVFDSH